MEVTASIFHAEVCMFSLMVFTRPSSWIPSEVTYWGIYNSLTVLHNILSLYNASWMLNTGVKKCSVLCTVSVCRVGWHSQSIWYCNYITCLYRFTYLKKKKSLIEERRTTKANIISLSAFWQVCSIHWIFPHQRCQMTSDDYQVRCESSSEHLPFNHVHRKNTCSAH